ncbi:MAG: hypothetical protein Q4D98_14220 [Planctomycetia bacterium]|nr:hypothetical protein [Planctomycetia bacterium]
MSQYQCPKCGCQHSRVYFTESAVKCIRHQWLAAVRRKRECRNCAHRWGTIEMEESETTWIPKVDNTENAPPLSED